MQRNRQYRHSCDLAASRCLVLLSALSTSAVLKWLMKIAGVLVVFARPAARPRCAQRACGLDGRLCGRWSEWQIKAGDCTGGGVAGVTVERRTPAACCTAGLLPPDHKWSIWVCVQERGTLERLGGCNKYQEASCNYLISLWLCCGKSNVGTWFSHYLAAQEWGGGGAQTFKPQRRVGQYWINKMKAEAIRLRSGCSFDLR